MLGGGDFERDFLELIKLRCHVKYRTWNFRATRFPKSVLKLILGSGRFSILRCLCFMGTETEYHFPNHSVIQNSRNNCRVFGVVLGIRLWIGMFVVRRKMVGTHIDPDASSVPHSIFRTPLLPNQNSLSHVLWSHRYLSISRWRGMDYLC